MSSHPAARSAVREGQSTTVAGDSSTCPSSPLYEDVTVDTSTFTSPTTDSLLRAAPRSNNPWFIEEEEVEIGGAKQIICHYRSIGRYEGRLPLSDAFAVIKGQVSAAGDLYAVQWLSSNSTKHVSSILRPCFRDTSPTRPTQFEPKFGPNRVRNKYKSENPPAEGERQGQRNRVLEHDLAGMFFIHYLYNFSINHT